jgi:hypothetical protein
VAGAGDPAQSQEYPAVDGSQGERGKGAGEQSLPAGPGKSGADAGGELGISPELNHDLVDSCDWTLRYRR